MMIQSMLSELIKTPSGSAQERLALEIGYAARVCGEESRPMLACALEKALGWARQNGAVTKAQVEQIERELSALSPGSPAIRSTFISGIPDDTAVS